MKPPDDSPEELARVKAAFSKRRARHIAGTVVIGALMLFAAVLPGALSEPFGSKGPMLLFILLAIAVIQGLYDWCCPACGRSLGRAMNPRFCSRCGVPLQ